MTEAVRASTRAAVGMGIPMGMGMGWVWGLKFNPQSPRQPWQVHGWRVPCRSWCRRLAVRRSSLDVGPETTAEQPNI